MLLKERLDRILDGKGEPGDLDYLHSLSETIKTASRCGLGQTSPNPVLSTLTNFRDVYESLVKPREGALKRSFDFRAAVQDAEGIAGREPDLVERRS